MARVGRRPEQYAYTAMPLILRRVFPNGNPRDCGIELQLAPPFERVGVHASACQSQGESSASPYSHIPGSRHNATCCRSWQVIAPMSVLARTSAEGQFTVEPHQAYETVLEDIGFASCDAYKLEETF